MAIIQNSEVIQKLVDELGLSPALEKIPTELAEKILPVFQVNEADVNVTIEENLTHYRDITDNDSDKTFTVPDDKKWKIKNFCFNHTSDGNAANRFHRILVLKKNGDTVYRLDSNVAVVASKATVWVGGQIQMNATNDGVFKGGQDDLVYNFYFPRDMVLQEGDTIQVVVYSGLEAGDDMHTFITVDEQDA